MSNVAGITKFQIRKAGLYVPVVTLKTESINKLIKPLETGFERSVIWNEYKTSIETVTQAQNEDNFKRIMLDASYPGVNRLFVMGFSNNAADRIERDSHTEYFLPRTKIKDYNVLIDGRKFYGQNINDELKKYEELREIMIGNQNYETGSLIDYAYYKKHYKSVACNLSKQKILDSNARAAQQIEFIFKLDNTDANGNTAQILNVLEKEKETRLGFIKGSVKIL